MSETKRKVAPSIIIANPPTRKRTTWSEKKQSEANLIKALAKSAKEVAEKRKKKVGEPSEVVHVEEVELILENESVKFPTPSAKKRNISQKKSHKTESEVEVSIVSKQTRSVKIGKKAQVVEKKSEGEIYNEEDKNMRFQKRTIL